ncbi:MAG: hypothetical protein HPY73_04255 [Methanomassiliicoccales archaeon]|nr:MAG: hypothetical protein HPY73_04255 [Methanomassiliicoccales archaeon]
MKTRGEFGNDAYYHLMVGKLAIKESALPLNDPGMVPLFRRTYPPMIHELIRLLGVERSKRWISPSIDSLLVILAYLIAVSARVKVPLFVPAVFVISSWNLIDGSSINPRPISNLLLNFMLLILLVVIQYHLNILFIFIMMPIIIALICLTNKLALQTSVPFVMLVGIFMTIKTPGIGLAILSSMIIGPLLANLITRGWYLKVGLPDHIKYLRHHLKKGHYLTGKKGFESPLWLIKSNPVTYLSLPFSLFLLNEEVEVGFILILIFCLTIWILSQFWVWGDGWRYLQFGTIASAIVMEITIESVFSPELTLWFLTVFLISLGFLASIQLKKSLQGDKAKDLDSIIDEIPAHIKEKIRKSTYYSNLKHYFIPWKLGGSIVLGNPSSLGMDFNRELAFLEKQSPEKIIY